MKILENNITLVDTSTFLYVGENGHYFAGSTDLGISFEPTVSYVSESEFSTATNPGVYFVFATNGAITIQTIDASGNKAPLSQTAVVPHVGENGNWFVGDTDTGVLAVAQNAVESFTLLSGSWATGSEYTYYTADKDNVYTLVLPTTLPNSANPKVSLKIPTNMSEAMLHLEQFEKITTVTVKDGNIIFDCIRGIPDCNLTVNVEVSFGANADINIKSLGATLDDNTVNNTTGWSSTKIVNYINEHGVPGKNLEYSWDGTKLGVRQEGYTNYNYMDLKGSQGPSGVDGASVVDAELSDEGHLVLTIQDPEDDSVQKIIEEKVASALSDLTQRITALEEQIAQLTDSTDGVLAQAKAYIDNKIVSSGGSVNYTDEEVNNVIDDILGN